MPTQIQSSRDVQSKSCKSRCFTLNYVQTTYTEESTLLYTSVGLKWINWQAICLPTRPKILGIEKHSLKFISDRHHFQCTDLLSIYKET